MVNADPNNPHSEKVPVLKCGQFGLPLVPDNDQVHNKILIALQGEKPKSTGAAGELKGSEGQPYLEVREIYP